MNLSLPRRGIASRILNIEGACACAGWVTAPRPRGNIGVDRPDRRRGSSWRGIAVAVNVRTPPVVVSASLFLTVRNILFFFHNGRERRSTFGAATKTGVHRHGQSSGWSAGVLSFKNTYRGFDGVRREDLAQHPVANEVGVIVTIVLTIWDPRTFWIASNGVDQVEHAFVGIAGVATGLATRSAPTSEPAERVTLAT